jgi:hypothetical protein
VRKAPSTLECWLHASQIRFAFSPALLLPFDFETNSIFFVSFTFTNHFIISYVDSRDLDPHPFSQLAFGITRWLMLLLELTLQDLDFTLRKPGFGITLVSMASPSHLAQISHRIGSAWHGVWSMLLLWVLWVSMCLLDIVVIEGRMEDCVVIRHEVHGLVGFVLLGRSSLLWAAVGTASN